MRDDLRWIRQQADDLAREVNSSWPVPGKGPFFNAVGRPIRRVRGGGRPIAVWSLVRLEREGEPPGFCRFRPSLQGDKAIEVAGVVYKRTPRRTSGGIRIFAAASSR